MHALTRLLVLTLTFLWADSAYAAVDSAAAVVLLRKTCTENGATLNNCFSSMGAMNTWIWATRIPSEASPLHVQIGPGKFVGQFTCTDRGHVTLTGAGVNNTVLENTEMPIATTRCTNLTFESMTIRNNGTALGVRNTGGLTVWNNVEIVATGYAWFDSLSQAASCANPGKHIWHNSRIVATTGYMDGNPHAVAYYNVCDEALFLGSELTAKATHHIGSSWRIAKALITYSNVTRIYGGALRALSAPGVIVTEMHAVTANPGSEVHIHGTGVDMISSAPNHLTALFVVNAMVHANGAAYMMKTGAGGTATRLFTAGEGSMVMAPYVWEPRAQPPSIVSLTGQDTVVVTDTVDGKPHSLVYQECCGGNCNRTWFDVNTNECFLP